MYLVQQRCIFLTVYRSSRVSSYGSCFLGPWKILTGCNGLGVQGILAVYVTLLGATKAFDRVRYVKLFQLLLRRSMCPALVKFLESPCSEATYTRTLSDPSGWLKLSLSHTGTPIWPPWQKTVMPEPLCPLVKPIPQRILSRWGNRACS